MDEEHKAEVRAQFDDMDIPKEVKDLIFALGEVDDIGDIAFALECCLCTHHLRHLLAMVIRPKSDHSHCTEHQEVH